MKRADLSIQEGTIRGALKDLAPYLQSLQTGQRLTSRDWIHIDHILSRAHRVSTLMRRWAEGNPPPSRVYVGRH
jgi:hypothetical protein